MGTEGPWASVIIMIHEQHHTLDAVYTAYLAATCSLQPLRSAAPWQWQWHWAKQVQALHAWLAAMVLALRRGRRWLAERGAYGMLQSVCQCG